MINIAFLFIVFLNLICFFVSIIQSTKVRFFLNITASHRVYLPESMQLQDSIVVKVFAVCTGIFIEGRFFILHKLIEIIYRFDR